MIGTFDSIGFTDSLGEHLETIRRLTGWKDENPEEMETMKVHKSHEHFNLNGSLLKKFLRLNREDYILYYTIKNNLEKTVFK